MGKLVVFQGPSGAGKSTLGKLCGLPLFTTYTSRTPRPGEVNGEDYYFVSKDQLCEMHTRGELCEFIRYGDNYYGTTNFQLGTLINGDQDYYTILTAEGAEQYRDLLPSNIFVIGIFCSQLNAYTRLCTRYGSEYLKIVERIQGYDKEVLDLAACDTVISTDLPIEMSLQGVKAIIKLLGKESVYK